MLTINLVIENRNLWVGAAHRLGKAVVTAPRGRNSIEGSYQGLGETR